MKLLNPKYAIAIVAVFVLFSCKKNLTNTWSELGGTFNSTIYCITTDANGNVYAGGTFTNGVNASTGNCYVAKWNGTAWKQLGDNNDTTFNKGIRSITIDANGNVYVGGGYTVAKWNGTTWSKLGGINDSTFNRAVISITTDINGNVYAGGAFINGNGKHFVAKWNGSNWSELGGINSSTFNDNIFSLTTDASGNVYAGGLFTDINGKFYVAKWNGSNWSELGGAGSSTFNAQIYSITTDAQGNVYAAGRFSSPDYGGSYVAKWNGTLWSGIYGKNQNTSLSTLNNEILSIATNNNGDLYAGGYFTYSPASLNTYMAKWNGIGWSELSVTNNLTNNSNLNEILSITTDDRGNVYAAGNLVDSKGKLYVAKCQQ